LAEETIATVVERTGGVPLFVEELTRAVLESGDSRLTGRAIPATLYDSLMARLDRLGPAKEVIQVGAVLGSDFSYALLHAAHPIAEGDLQRALRSLTDAELLYVRGIAPEANYQFKHALIRDAAYEALLKSRRKELHLIIARTIDQKLPTFKETHPEVLARHWTEAGEIESAIAAWQKAGEHSIQRHAFREAEEHYRQGLGALMTLAASPDRDMRELTLQVSLGNVLMATRGYSGNTTLETYKRARLLAEAIGGAQSWQVLNGLWGSTVTHGELPAALALAEEMLKTVQAIDNPVAHADAHYAMGLSQHMRADLVEARRHFAQAVERYSREEFKNVFDDPVIKSLSWAGPTAWHLGYPNTAVRYVHDAVELAQRHNNLYGLAFARAVEGQLYLFRREFQRGLDAALEEEKLAAQLGFPLWDAIGKISIGWARANLGSGNDAVDLIRQGLAGLAMLEFRQVMTLFLCMLSEAQTAIGEIGDALSTIDEGLQINLDELIYRPRLLHLRGQLLLKSEMAGAKELEVAERDFRAAIDLSRKWNAKSDELPASTSLARLLAKQGRRDEARTMLADIYNWFTEGFDTADLIDAKALLDELSG
jgi:tetratricopeptide (TPR) repeat protein